MILFCRERGGGGDVVDFRGIVVGCGFSVRGCDIWGRYGIGC